MCCRGEGGAAGCALWQLDRAKSKPAPPPAHVHVHTHPHPRVRPSLSSCSCAHTLPPPPPRSHQPPHQEQRQRRGHPHHPRVWRQQPVHAPQCPCLCRTAPRSHSRTAAGPGPCGRKKRGSGQREGKVWLWVCGDRPVLSSEPEVKYLMTLNAEHSRCHTSAPTSDHPSPYLHPPHTHT